MHDRIGRDDPRRPGPEDALEGAVGENGMNDDADRGGESRATEQLRRNDQRSASGDDVVHQHGNAIGAVSHARQRQMNVLVGETLLLQQMKMNTQDLDQVVNVIGTLTKLVTALQTENAQFRAILTAPKELAPMPALFGSKKEGRKAN